MACAANLSGWHIPHRWGACRCGFPFSAETIERMRREMHEYERHDYGARVRLGVA